MSNQMDAKADEKWRKERMYGGQDTVLWAILVDDRVEGMPPFRVVGSFLREDEADIAIRCHNERDALQQQIADLRAERDSMRSEVAEILLAKTEAWIRMTEAEAERDRYREVAIKVAHSRKGYCPVCEAFSGYDSVQEIQGDEPHDDWCWIGQELRGISPSPIAPGEAQG